jgi:hypothetical protein
METSCGGETTVQWCKTFGEVRHATSAPEAVPPIAFNAQAAFGPWLSFGNNRVHRNTAAGMPPTAIGAITHDVGQQ